MSNDNNTCPTLFELVKQEMEVALPLSQEEVLEAVGDIGRWGCMVVDARFLMLLNRDKNDYTIFNMWEPNHWHLAKELQEVLESRGKIIYTEFNEKFNYYEIWVRDAQGETGFFLLFSCDDFMVDVGDEFSFIERGTNEHISD